MINFSLTIGILWLAFWVYWLASARNHKKVLEHPKRGPRFLFVIFVVAVLALSHLPFFHVTPFTTNPVAITVGVIVCALGLSFAVWARIHLGKNWNVEPSIQEGHELVTSGPYQWVRHPIYTGWITAFLGSTIVGNWVWLVIFAGIAVIFALRIKAEEDYMLRLFPQAYPEYKARTKALIPFIW